MLGASLFSKSCADSGSPSDARYESFKERYQDQQDSINLSKSAAKRCFDDALGRTKIVTTPTKDTSLYDPPSLTSVNSPQIHFAITPSIEPFDKFDPHESPSQKFARKSDRRIADLENQMAGFGDS
jgi:hypothetical protein